MQSNKPHIDFIELHILHHASEEPIYGLWMIEELSWHGYSLNASQLYPRFHRLQKKGLLDRKDRVVDGKLRKYYRIRPAGRAYLKEQKRRLIELASEALTAEQLAETLRRRRARDQVKQRSFWAAGGNSR
jgi:DNA-binding PadR family transcriptional regulator